MPAVLPVIAPLIISESLFARLLYGSYFYTAANFSNLQESVHFTFSIEE